MEMEENRRKVRVAISGSFSAFYRFFQLEEGKDYSIMMPESKAKYYSLALTSVTI